jgi:hypothetical protein
MNWKGSSAAFGRNLDLEAEALGLNLFLVIRRGAKFDDGSAETRVGRLLGLKREAAVASPALGWMSLRPPSLRASHLAPLLSLLTD